ncbi:hypothetical protein LV779_12860 [Streptomyces thinghirensis]|nr:hypothetical protein [Streptomyces thinghirensis]
MFFFWGWDAAFAVAEETRDVRDVGAVVSSRLLTMRGDLPVQGHRVPARTERPRG